MRDLQRIGVRLLLLLLCLALGGLPGASASGRAGEPGQADEKAESAEQAKRLLLEAIKARGGDRYLGYKTLFATGQFTPFQRGVSTIPTAFEDTIVYPDKERVEFGRGKKKDRRIQVNVGGTGWVYDGDAETLKDQTEEQTREFLDNLQYDLDHVLREGWKASGARVRYAGREELRPGERAEVVEIELAPERKVHLWLDRNTHLPLSLIYEKVGDQGLTKNEYRYFQYVSYDGVKFPNIVDFYRDGVQVFRVNYQSIKLDVPVAEAIFAKPASVKAIK